MKLSNKPYVVAADRLDGSLIITFNDGRCGIFSSELLYATLSQAKELQEVEEPEVQPVNIEGDPL